MQDNQKDHDRLIPQRLPSDVLEQKRKALVLPSRIRALLRRYIALVLLAQSNGSTAAARNGVLVFTGPPGTGKTMTAEVAAQVVADNVKRRSGKDTVLFELSASDLFSDLLGKSAKNIAEVFEMIEFSAKRQMTIIIMDDVESTVYTRLGISAGDPTDVTRAVDQLLRQLDSLAGNPQFLLVATSNLSTALDDAFLDRADYVIKFDNPDRDAAARILANAAEQCRSLGIEIALPEIEKAVKTLCKGDGARSPSGRLLSKLPIVTYLESGSRRPTAGLLVQIARNKLDGPYS
jgi:SpoVK/Ycf46/Vps4 family AAA+-type ATPase